MNSAADSFSLENNRVTPPNLKWGVSRLAVTHFPAFQGVGVGVLNLTALLAVP